MTRNTSKEETVQQTSPKTTSVKKAKTTKASTAKSKAKTTKASAAKSKASPMKRKVMEINHFKEKLQDSKERPRTKQNRVQIRRNKSKVLVHTIIYKNGITI